jgi:hypothetical protein
MSTINKSANSTAAFTSSFHGNPFVSTTILIHSAFNFVKSSISHFACKSGSHPETVNPHFFQKYGFISTTLSTISSADIILPPSQGIVSGL